MITQPEHSALTFGDTGGEPILSYRHQCTTGAKVGGKPVPDGWVLFTHDGDQYITGITALTSVDEAVASAEKWLAQG